MKLFVYYELFDDRNKNDSKKELITKENHIKRDYRNPELLSS